MRIISIDPGYGRLGIAILEKKENQPEILIFSDCLQTSSRNKFEERLKIIGDKITDLIKKYKPTVLIIEDLFFNNNQTTAFKVSEIKGAIKYLALSKQLAIFEFTPLQIKMAVTGYGKSNKKQVTSMVMNLIEIKKEIKYDDEYDAIAVGLTYFATNPL